MNEEEEEEEEEDECVLCKRENIETFL